MGILPMLDPQIGLTEAQRDQIKAIGDSHKDEWKALADRERASRDAVNDAINADTVDDGVIRQKSADASFVDADMAVARAHARAEVFQILTAEQKTKVKEMQAQMKKMRAAGKDARRGKRSGLMQRLGL
jgi:Spy/CpxP family protein refolding chaperone